MRITKITGIVITGIMLIVGACSSASKAPSSAQVTAGNTGGLTEGWRTVSVSISTGGVVTWVNKGNLQHSVISDQGLFNETLSFEQSFNYTFSKPGTYTYHDNPNTELDIVVVK